MTSSGSVEEILKFMHGGNEVLLAAEAPGDLENIAVAADRRHPALT